MTYWMGQVFDTLWWGVRAYVLVYCLLEWSVNAPYWHP